MEGCDEVHKALQIISIIKLSSYLFSCSKKGFLIDCLQKTTFASKPQSAGGRRGGAEEAAEARWTFQPAVALGGRRKKGRRRSGSQVK